jgi:hypothetical protein
MCGVRSRKGNSNDDGYGGGKSPQQQAKHDTRSWPVKVLGD